MVLVVLLFLGGAFFLMILNGISNTIREGFDKVAKSNQELQQKIQELLETQGKKTIEAQESSDNL